MVFITRPGFCGREGFEVVHAAAICLSAPTRASDLPSINATTNGDAGSRWTAATNRRRPAEEEFYWGTETKKMS
jgi:hypothetical protein